MENRKAKKRRYKKSIKKYAGRSFKRTNNFMSFPERPMWRVVLYVGFPLALYESLNQLFKILDTAMASHIGIRGVRGFHLSQIT